MMAVAPGIDVLIACPPCTGFSRVVANNHVRDDPRNSLVARVADYAEYFTPRVIFMENARELLRGRFSHHFERECRRGGRACHGTCVRERSSPASPRQPVARGARPLALPGAHSPRAGAIVPGDGIPPSLGIRPAVAVLAPACPGMSIPGARCCRHRGAPNPRPEARTGRSAQRTRRSSRKMAASTTAEDTHRAACASTCLPGQLSPAWPPLGAAFTSSFHAA